MAGIARIKMQWSGFTGGPGFSVFHFRDFTAGEVDQATVDGAITKVRAFATAIAGDVPNGTQFQVQGDVEVIEETNGQLIDVLSSDGGAAIPSTAPAGLAYSAASGACVTWRTNGIRNGRRIRGRTFIVPMHGSAYDTNGTIGPTIVPKFVTAANNLRDQTGAGDLGVWARPTAPGANDGIWYVVTGSTVNDKVAILRSRRD